MEICPVTRMRIEQVKTVDDDHFRKRDFTGRWSSELVNQETGYWSAVNCGRGVCGPQYYHSGSNLVWSVPIIIHEDNLGAIAIAKNPVGHGRTKHIDTQYHFVLKQVNVATDEMLADILTKPLPNIAIREAYKWTGTENCQISTVESGSVAITKLTAFISSLILMLRQLFEGCFFTLTDKHSAEYLFSFFYWFVLRFLSFFFFVFFKSLCSFISNIFI